MCLHNTYRAQPLTTYLSSRVALDAAVCRNSVCSSALVEAGATGNGLLAGDYVLQGLHDVAIMSFLMTLGLSADLQPIHRGNAEASAVRQEGVCDSPL